MDAILSEESLIQQTQTSLIGENMFIAKFARKLTAWLPGSAALVLSTVPGFAQEDEQILLSPITLSGGKGVVPVEVQAASKSALPLARLPQSVSVVTERELVQRQVQNATEALRYVPGVNGEVFGADPRSDWIRVRGFGTQEYLDGLRLARGNFAWPRVEPYFLDQIEVLKGPAGSLYGQTPPGGLLNMVSKMPVLNPLRQVGLTFGDPKRAQIMADFGGRLTADDRLSYRFSGLFRKADTNVDHVNDDRAAVSAALTWRPTAHTTLTVQAFSIKDSAKSAQFLPQSGILDPNPNGTIPRDRFTGEPSWDDYDLHQNMLGYMFAHEFDNGVKLSHRLRWSEVDYDLKVARPFGYVPGMDDLLFRQAVRIIDRTKALNADTNLSYDFHTGAARHDVIVGVDYLAQDTDYEFQIGSIAPINVYKPEYGAVPGSLATLAHHATELRQTGIYLQDEITLANWTFLLSARNDWWERQQSDKATGMLINRSGSHATWRAGAVYGFGNGASAYASYATSFEPLIDFDKPTESAQFELGLKYQPETINALFTMAAFDLRQKNTRVGHGLTAMQIGESRVRGIELEGRAELAQRWDISAAFAYLDTEIISGSSDPHNGKQLPYTAKTQASLWLSHDFSGALDGLTLAGGLRYMGPSFADAANSVETGDYLLADAAISYDMGATRPEFEGARFDLSISNLTDESFVAACENATACYWGTGRTVRGALVYEF